MAVIQKYRLHCGKRNYLTIKSCSPKLYLLKQEIKENSLDAEILFIVLGVDVWFLKLTLVVNQFLGLIRTFILVRLKKKDLWATSTQATRKMLPKDVVELKYNKIETFQEGEEFD